MELQKLKEPMPFRWKVQTANEYGCQCVAYIDARQAMDKLDEVVGPDCWQSRFILVNGNLFCEVGIKCNDEWIWKSDCGVESNIEKQKGEASDAFKRACVHWGIGRFLYEMDTVKVPAANYKGKTNNQKQLVYQPSRVKGDANTILWEKSDLSDYCMKMHNGQSLPLNEPAPQVVASKPKATKNLLDDVHRKLEDATEWRVDKMKLQAVLLELPPYKTIPTSPRGVAFCVEELQKPEYEELLRDKIPY